MWTDSATSPLNPANIGDPYPDQFHSQYGESLFAFGGLFDNLSVATPIPEPTTIFLMGFGILGLLGVVIRQRRKMK